MYSANVQADTTANKIDAGDFLLAFVKKIYLNPGIVSIKKEFERNGGRTVIILPDPKSENIDTISKIEKAMRKLLLFIIEGGKDEAIKLHFNPKNQKQPFSFKHPESIWCKFTRADKDSIARRLNAPFAGTDLYSLNAATFERAVGDGLDYIKRRLRAVFGPCGDKPDKEITEINTKPLSISVHNTAGSRYDTDSKHYAPLALYYEKAFDVHTRTDVYAPAKYLVQGQSDKIAVAIHKNESPFLKQNIRFRKTYDNQTIPILSSSTNDTIRLDLPPNLPTNKPIEIAVEYESPLDSVKYTVGVIMVYVYPIQTPKVNVIAANGASLNESEIKRALDKVYLPVGVNFDVRRLSMSFGPSYPTAIEMEKSGLLSNYPPDLKGYVRDVRDLPTYSKDEYYLVVGLNAAAFEGYMPRARNIGFIFSSESEKINKVIAHELGHGVFHLKHIFDGDELGSDFEGTTDNLMDYSLNPRELYLHQWKYINDPASVVWFLEDVEDGAVFGAAGTVVRSICNQYVIDQVNTHSIFYDPVGGIVDLSKAPGAKANRFYTILEENPVARGALEGFMYNGEQYVVKFNRKLQNPFLGYLKSNSTEANSSLDISADPTLDTSAATKVIMKCSTNEIRFSGDPRVLTYDCGECSRQINKSFFTKNNPNFYTQLFESDAHFATSFESAIDNAVVLINNNIGNLTTAYPPDDESKIHLINFNQFATTTTTGISGLKDEPLKEIENLLQDLYRTTDDHGSPVHFVVMFQYVNFIVDNNLWNVYANKVLKRSKLNHLDDVILVTIPYSLPALSPSGPNSQKAFWMPGLSTTKPNRVNIDNLETGSYDAKDFEIFLKDVFIQTVKPYDYYSYVVNYRGRIQFSRISLAEWKSGLPAVNKLTISFDTEFSTYERYLECGRLMREKGGYSNTHVKRAWARDREKWLKIDWAYNDGLYTPSWQSSDINLKSYCVRQYHSRYFYHYLADHFREFKADNNLTDPESVPTYAKINPLADDPVLAALDFFSLLTSVVGLDVVFDAIGTVYVFIVDPENYSEILFRASATTLPFVNGGAVKIGREGVKSISTTTLKNFGKKAGGDFGKYSKTIDDLPTAGLRSRVANSLDEAAKLKFVDDYFDPTNLAFKKAVDADYSLVEVWKKMDQLGADEALRRNLGVNLPKNRITQ